MNGHAILCRCGRRMKNDTRAKAPGRYLCGCGAAFQFLDIIERRCVVPRRFGRICGLEAAVDKPIPLCPAHVTDLLEQPSVLTHDAMLRAMEQAADREALKRAEREVLRRGYERHEQIRAEKLRRQAVVYYIRRDTRIKIGTTTNMRVRMANLQPDEILATEPGGRQVERGRHKQFAHLRYRGEWFTPADDLLEHIARIRAKHGEPTITTHVRMEAAS